MIQMQTLLDVADNTGAKSVMCIGVLGASGKKTAGIGDIMAYETFPAGTHVLVRKGETLHMHCYAHNFSPESRGYFHHMVRVLYW